MPPSTKDKESAISKPTSGRREKSSAISKESRANLQTDKETRFFLCGRMASIESQYYSLPISQSELDGTQDDRENLARYLKAFSTIEEALTNIFDVPDPYSDRRKTTRTFALKKAEEGCNDAEKLIQSIKRKCEKQMSRESGETVTGSDSDRTERGSQASEGSAPPSTSDQQL